MEPEVNTVVTEQDDLDKERAKVCRARMVLKLMQKQLGNQEKALEYKQKKLWKNNGINMLEILKEANLESKEEE